MRSIEHRPRAIAYAAHAWHRAVKTAGQQTHVISVCKIVVHAEPSTCRRSYNQEVLGLLVITNGISQTTHDGQKEWHVACALGITRKFLAYS